MFIEDTKKTVPAQKWNLWTLANFVTFLRFPLGILAYWYLYQYLSVFPKNNTYHTYAIVFFGIAALTDFVDGKIARKFTTSHFGEVLDPILDKFLAAIIFVIDWKLSLILVCIELVSLFWANRVRKAENRFITLPLSKYVTLLQSVLIIILLFATRFEPWNVLMIFWIILCVTAVRPFSYFYYYKYKKDFLSFWKKS